MQLTVAGRAVELTDPDRVSRLLLRGALSRYPYNTLAYGLAAAAICWPVGQSPMLAWRDGKPVPARAGIDALFDAALAQLLAAGASDDEIGNLAVAGFRRVWPTPATEAPADADFFEPTDEPPPST